MRSRLGPGLECVSAPFPQSLSPPRVWCPDAAGLPAASSHGRHRLLPLLPSLPEARARVAPAGSLWAPQPAEHAASLVFSLTPPPYFWTEEWGLVLIWGPGTVRRGLCPRTAGGRPSHASFTQCCGQPPPHRLTAPASWPQGLPLPSCPLSLGLGVYGLWWAGAGGGRGQRTTVDAVSHWEEEARTS